MPTTITRVNFGFPINVTEEINFSEIEEFKKKDFTNKNLHLKITTEDKLGKNFNSETFKEEVKNATHCNNIKIDYYYNNESSERSKEVAEAQTLVDKFKKYAKLNEIKYSDTVIAKLEDIQDHLLINNSVPSDTFELEYISLRGNVGIWDGQQKDDIEFDFSKFNDGIVCMTGPNGCGKCITGDSIVLTDDGFERIGKYGLRRKDGFTPFVKTLHTENKNKAESSHFYTEQVSHTIKITNSLGMSLTGTPDHPILVINKDCDFEFKKLKDITTEDYACIPRGMNAFPTDKPLNYVLPNYRRFKNTKEINLPKKMSLELARFLGYYMANGSCANYRISFSSKNKKLQDDWQYCVKKLFGLECKTYNDKDFSFQSIVVKHFIKAITKYPVTVARRKIVPVSILESSKEYQRAFLTAYFDCDSSIFKNEFELSTASKNMAQLIQNMLLNFGVISVLTSTKVKGYYRPYYKLFVHSTNIERLTDSVMNNSLKYSYKKNTYSNPNTDIIPFLKEYSKNYFKANKAGQYFIDGKRYLSPLNLTRAINISYNFLDGLIERVKKHPSPITSNFLAKLEMLKNKNYFYSKILKIEHINSPVTVYDFTIPTTHSFYSNGFISHNTTCIEMMNPYNSHLTRMGSLKDYFRLKDSHKILIYRNSAGRRYKISMFIDGKATSVMTTYKIDIMEPGSDKWIDGPEVKSADDYKKWVEAVFGPKDMFLRTAFFTTKQIKNLPDLSVATKTEKMVLFSNLAGIDYLSMIQDAAKDRIKIEEGAIEDIKGQIKNYDNIEERLSEIDKEIENNNSDLEKYKELINIDNEELALCNEEQKKYLTAAGAFDIVKRTLTEKEIKIDDNIRETGRIEVKISSYNEDLEDLDLYKEQLAWWNENTPKLKTLNSEKDKIDAERNEAAKKYNTALTENRNVEKNIDSIKNAIYKYDLEIKSLTKSIPEIDGNCPVCGAPLSEHKKEELENEVKSIKEQISKLEETKVNAEKEITDLQTTIKDVSSLEDEYNKLNSKYMEIANDITDIQTYSERIDIDKVKDVINNYAVKVEELNNTKDVILKENEQLAKDIEELRTQLNTMPTDYTDKINRLTRGIQDSQQNIATLTAENTSLAREKKTLTSNEALVKKIKTEIKEREKTIKEYMILQLAFSNNGIQALELDSAAPEISEIANSILYSSYGERFTIKFDTQRNTKDNKKTIDDFIIRVFDGRSGSWKVLEDLSQGESLWIKQALYYAFSVIRARRTGFCFKTRFLDESDGPLDTATTRLTYLKMIEMAHKMSNASKTILITHSADIKEMIEQSISM